MNLPDKLESQVSKNDLKTKVRVNFTLDKDFYESFKVYAKDNDIYMGRTAERALLKAYPQIKDYMGKKPDAKCKSPQNYTLHNRKRVNLTLNKEFYKAFKAFSIDKGIFMSSALEKALLKEYPKIMGKG